MKKTIVASCPVMVRVSVITTLCYLAAFITACGDGSGNRDSIDNSGSNDGVSIVENYECNPSSSVGLSADMEAAIALAETRYSVLPARTAASNNKYLSYTDTNGVWELQNNRTWTSGFLPGMYWYLYSLTGVESWRTAAEASSAGVRDRATGTDNDTGFQVYTSYGVGRTVLGGIWSEADTAMSEAANTLIIERYNPTIGAFRSWPQNKSDPYDITRAEDFEVNVDMLMNMEALLSAAQLSGDTDQVIAAVSHADVTWDNIFRDDFSTHHVGAFEANGTLGYTRTHQGWTDNSTWSRGQAWAVYGYAMLYRYTELNRMLEHSELAYQYFKQATHRQNSSWIPHADFDAAIDIRNPPDSSAAAIVASAAIELYTITGNTVYLDDANQIVNQLIEGYLSTGTDFESLLLAGSEQYVTEDDDLIPDSAGYEVGTIFGDFYFIEALFRLNNAESPVCI